MKNCIRFSRPWSWWWRKNSPFPFLAFAIFQWKSGFSRKHNDSNRQHLDFIPLSFYCNPIFLFRTFPNSSKSNFLYCFFPSSPPLSPRLPFLFNYTADLKCSKYKFIVPRLTQCYPFLSLNLASLGFFTRRAAPLKAPSCTLESTTRPSEGVILKTSG